MNQQKSFDINKITGTLYLVPTPIGNLEDMTFRSINTLKKVKLIASEDTRNTQKLLNHFEIETPQISFHDHNYKERIPQLIERLHNGDDLAQVSDAGMPSISDPGFDLVKSCVEEDIPVVGLPGASAGITALVASGLSPQPFLFYGFLPRKRKEMIETLTDLQTGVSATVIFYESPYRIKNTLQVIKEVYGEEQLVVLARELTKIHEEYLRGTTAELVQWLEEHEIKGECCLLVEQPQTGDIKTLQQIDERNQLSVKEHVLNLMETMGINSKDAIKQTAKERNIKKQEVYKIFHTEE